MTDRSPSAESGEQALEDPSAPAKNRMAVAVLTLGGIFLAFYLVANNLGWVPRVPCGTGDCGIVQSSKYAWVGPIPVSAIGLGGYLALFVLSLLGLQESMAGSRLIALLLFGGALAGVLYSGYLTYLEAAVIKAWCRYCVASAVLITIVFAATIPEVKRIRGVGAG